MTTRIRPQTPDDDATVREVVTAAFGDDGQVAALAEDLRARPERGAALVAVDDGRVIGHVQLSVSWIDTRDQLVDVLVLSPLSVAPDRQSQGVGGQLVAAARDEAERLGAPLLFLEGDPGFYSRHGYVAAGGFGVTPPSARIPAPAFQAVPLVGHDPATMRGALVYNDTFWTHDCVGLRGDLLDHWLPA